MGDASATRVPPPSDVASRALSTPLRALRVERGATRDDAICYALFDRAEPFAAEFAREENLLIADWFWALMDLYQVGIAP